MRLASRFPALAMVSRCCYLFLWNPVEAFRTSLSQFANQSKPSPKIHSNVNSLPDCIYLCICTRLASHLSLKLNTISLLFEVKVCGMKNWLQLQKMALTNTIGRSYLDIPTTYRKRIECKHKPYFKYHTVQKSVEEEKCTVYYLEKELISQANSARSCQATRYELAGVFNSPCFSRCKHWIFPKHFLFKTSQRELGGDLSASRRS